MSRRLTVVSLSTWIAVVPVTADVVQHHGSPTRDGSYVDPQMTLAAAGTMRLDGTFNGALPGPTYAQPLYLQNGAGGRPTLIVATEQDVILALDAADGTPIWTATVGTPVRRAALPCGNIDPLGITGTPVIDLRSRTLYFDAMTTPDGGVTKRHRVYALSIDDGSVRPGWPLDVNGLTAGGARFDSATQNQRGALLISNGWLYVPYGGHAGDCGDYHGWVVAAPVDHPQSPTAWATGAPRGGIWAPGGLATDGALIFAATGNTSGVDSWAGGEAMIRLRAGAVFSGDAADYFTPSDWRTLDAEDTDLGGSGPVIVDAPGAIPSQLVVALGKNGVAYLLDRNNLGGVGTGDGANGEGLFSMRVASGPIRNAAAAYTTASGTYVVFALSTGMGLGCSGSGGDLVALRIAASNPPTLAVAWCAANHGSGSPIVTTSDGSADPIIWTIGAEGTNRLYAYNGDTGETVFDGGGAADGMSFVRRFVTPIAADGRIFVAADNRLYAFALGSNVAFRR